MCGCAYRYTCMYVRTCRSCTSSSHPCCMPLFRARAWSPYVGACDYSRVLLSLTMQPSVAETPLEHEYDRICRPTRGNQQISGPHPAIPVQPTMPHSKPARSDECRSHNGQHALTCETEVPPRKKELQTQLLGDATMSRK